MRRLRGKMREGLAPRGMSETTIVYVRGLRATGSPSTPAR